MKIFLIYFLITLNGVALGGDVSRFIEDTVSYYPAVNGPRLKAFVGSFSIEPALAPNRLSKVNFEIEIINDADYYNNYDWELKLDFIECANYIMGDTQFTWPGPHKKGDRYSGCFEIQPLKSGTYHISLFLYRINQKKCSLSEGSEISFSYCIDEDGVLHYCGENKKLQPIECESAKVSFFDQKADSIFARGLYSQVLDFGFKYSYYMFPPPRIGDTSTIHFILESAVDIEGGNDISIVGTGINILTAPIPINYSIHKGEKIDLEFNFVPMVLDYHVFEIDLCGWDKSTDRKSCQTVLMSFIFHNDKGLKYISYTSPTQMPANKLPDSFPKIDYKKDRTSVLVTKEGETIWDINRKNIKSRHKR